MKRIIRLTVNDEKYEVAVEPNQTLVETLRDELGLTGTKQGCGVGDCGSCAVIMDGKPVNSCLVLAVQAGSFHIADNRVVNIIYIIHFSAIVMRFCCNRLAHG